MRDAKELLRKIKETVILSEPNAEVILYGSYARGDYTEKSDIDVLVLIDKKQVDSKAKRGIKYSLYDIEFETGVLISPMVFSKSDWELRQSKTPLYENIQKEGLRI